MAPSFSFLNMPFIRLNGNSAPLGMPNEAILIPKPSNTFSNNFFGFSIQSSTSPILSDNQSLPFLAVFNALPTTAFPPSTTLPVIALTPSLVF
ncbi:hypothetical protein [Staphylococcus hominis]|uniref:hypothetical protein n=2 Tax=Staphylococcus hominis TaxID=1290 RepID=UPI0039C2E3B9